MFKRLYTAFPPILEAILSIQFFSPIANISSYPNRESNRQVVPFTYTIKRHPLPHSTLAADSGRPLIKELTACTVRVYDHSNPK